MVRSLSLLLVLTALGTASAARPCAAQGMIEVRMDGRRLEGSPLAWSSRSVMLLGRDGRLWQFAPSAVGDFRQLASQFASYSQGQLRQQLLREFPSGYDVSGTGQYLVVHPAGQRDRWADRFEQLYRSVLHYFTARGVRLQRPAFPFIAVVFPRQQDFLRYAEAQGVPQVGQNTLGYYDIHSNRILVYDVTAGRPDDPNWTLNAETIIHEAVHQTAFNTGIHSRFARTPAWVVEGLGTMFEAPGVWDAARRTDLSDRVHRGQLRVLRQQLAAGRPRDTLAQLVASDRPFVTDVAAAYANAWSLSFFLSETEPRKYGRYLARMAQRPAFAEYTGPERLRDFAEVFGSDLAMIDARLARFVAQLPP